MIAPPQARNLAVGFTIPFGYLIGGGAIPTFIGVMGDAKLFALGFTITGTIDHGRGCNCDVAQTAGRRQSALSSFRLSSASGCSIKFPIMKAEEFAAKIRAE